MFSVNSILRNHMYVKQHYILKYLCTDKNIMLYATIIHYF